MAKKKIGVFVIFSLLLNSLSLRLVNLLSCIPVFPLTLIMMKIFLRLIKWIKKEFLMMLSLKMLEKFRNLATLTNYKNKEIQFVLSPLTLFLKPKIIFKLHKSN